MLAKVFHHVFHNQNMILSTPPIKTISLVFDEDMAHSLDEAEGLEVAEVVEVNFVRGRSIWTADDLGNDLRIDRLIA